MRAGRTARLTIEPLAPEHAPGLFAALDDERVGTFIGGPDVTTLNALHERITALLAGPPADRDEQWCNWVALLDGTVIGRLEATVHDGIAEVAYVFGPRWWGNGYATEGAAWMLDELAGAGIVTTWAAVVPENKGSIALLARLGFEPADKGAPSLWSFDPGDLTFRRG